MLQTLEPYLPSADLAATAAFWRDVLGFEVTGHNENWLRVARDDVAVMFGRGQVHSGFEGVFVVRSDDVDGIAEAASTMPEWGPRDTPDARHEVAFKDPNGYIVNFTQNIIPEGSPR